MISPQLITDTIPPVHLTDTVQKVLALMQDYLVTELPVLDGEKYAGLVTMEQINMLKNKKKTLESLNLQLTKPFVYQTAHIFDIMRVGIEYNVRIMPVVDHELNYWGVISAQSCLRSFADLNSINVAGAVLEVETDIKNYTLSELSRIIEESDISILCLYTDVNQQTGTIGITVKLNTTDVSAVVSSLERYEYTVRNVYNEAEYTDKIKSRYDALMRYLNV